MKRNSLPQALLLCLLCVVFQACDDTGQSGSSTDGSSVNGGPSSSVALWPPDGFSESAADRHGSFPETVATAVTVYAPLPDSFPDHPESCDYLRFLRIRHINGPANPSDAARILIAQPGVLEGASAFYTVAGNLVTRAFRERGAYIEFWAIDRRANGLEDLSGLELARETMDPHDFIDYYYRNKSWQGKSFAGFLNPYTDARWLAEMGMDRTLRDWNEVITRGIPDQAVRQSRVFLGGHSLGGFLTGAYACWDFDGDPDTVADAGYNQCAGYFALDSMVTSGTLMNVMSGSSVQLANLLGALPANVVALMRAGYFPRFVSLPGVIDPEVMTLLSGLGAAAYLWPHDESDSIAYMPYSLSSNLAYRFYHSRNLCAFLATTPSIKKIRLTNQALMAVFTDDNTMPISIVRSSMGFFTGGALADKNFPLSQAQAEALAEIPSLEFLTGFFGGTKLAIATDNGTSKNPGPLYRWLNYNEISGASIALAACGVPYTDASSEVTDINDFAFSMGALPLNFMEHYFPMRLAVESMMGTDGIVHADGVSRRPVIDIIAGDGPNLGGDNVRPGSPVIAGYDHLDVLTAAAVQNHGRPEEVTSHLLNFIFTH
jgi:hypothetical protein